MRPAFSPPVDRAGDAATPGRAAQTRDLRLIRGDQEATTVAGARALLSQGVDVNARAGDGATALQWAVYQENADAVGCCSRPAPR